MRVFITGDTHIPYDIHKLNTKNFPNGKDLTKNDIVIICGDFGGVWYDDKEERFWLSWLENKPWTTVFVDGNHECFPRLNALPQVNWHGGTVGVISPSILHLKRGEYYQLPNGMSLFTLGGAKSRDIQYRTEGLNWWKEELPSKKELDYARQQLDKHQWRMDLIITHEASHRVLRQLGFKVDGDYFSDFLSELSHCANFKCWANGHLHKDALIDDIYLSTYQMIWEVSKNESELILHECFPTKKQKN